MTPDSSVVDRVKNVRAMLAHDELMNTPSRTHPNLPIRCESSSPAFLMFQIILTASTIRLTAANATRTPWATFRYGCTRSNHLSYCGFALCRSVATPSSEATSVFLSVDSHSIVFLDCFWYMLHKVFSSQLNVRVFWHACPPSSSVASSHSPCDGDSSCVVWFNAVHCADGVDRISASASLRW